MYVMIIIYNTCRGIPAEEQKVRTSGQHYDYGYTVLGLVVARQSQRRYGHHEQTREQKHHSCWCYGLWKKEILCIVYVQLQLLFGGHPKLSKAKAIGNNFKRAVRAKLYDLIFR